MNMGRPIKNASRMGKIKGGIDTIRIRNVETIMNDSRHDRETHEYEILCIKEIKNPK